MFPILNSEMLRKIEQLIDANYSGRDELYAAANSLHNSHRSQICRQLAEHLAGHAAELQQWAAANSGTPVEPLDLYAVAEAFFAFVRNRGGDAEVLKAAEACERVVRERYDGVLQKVADGSIEEILKRQREEVEFGEHVLGAMNDPPDRTPG